MQAIQYKQIGIQGEIGAKDQEIDSSWRRYVGYVANEDKSYDITIVAKSNEAGKYPYISLCGQHSYRKR